jgi:actin-related protein
VDIAAIPGLLQKVFQDLNVDQRSYDVILSVPRSFNAKTQTEIINILFDQFGVSAVNMTHQSVLALYSYNATSGVVVDIGERMDIVPINEGMREIY